MAATAVDARTNNRREEPRRDPNGERCMLILLKTETSKDLRRLTST
ncbi:hypothetical protein HMPREF0297_0887 [Corynebacterium jeikeium ATCC 43734]|nr:hypothetical protein HMPREF0297_0887 [Corynebacterium jeikeium ATCC 43734]